MAHLAERPTILAPPLARQPDGDTFVTIVFGLITVTL